MSVCKARIYRDDGTDYMIYGKTPHDIAVKFDRERLIDNRLVGFEMEDEDVRSDETGSDGNKT